MTYIIHNYIYYNIIRNKYAKSINQEINLLTKFYKSIYTYYILYCVCIKITKKKLYIIAGKLHNNIYLDTFD